jgi:hypothetical protein
MALPISYSRNPYAVVGKSFQFSSGYIYLQRCHGMVREVQEAPNATGQMGFVVIHTLEDGKLYRTRWSYFREHAKVLED